jgi:MFS family permease
MRPAKEQADPPLAPVQEVGGRYAWYALGVLTLVYVFNFVDRQIPSILAEEIKADLGLRDADLAFLYGTAFAVFYGALGIPLGRLADVWVRRSLISIGLFFWSAMTALSGTAQSFRALAAYRIGVGVGEASASPAAFSMLSDYFPPSLRATALSIYSSGVYIGAGIGVFLGGWIVEGWRAAFPESPPLGIRPWQAAFLAVGVPGLAMALRVFRLREPVRGQSEGIVAAATSDRPAALFARELLSMLPPLHLFGLLRAGAGARGVAVNLAGGLLLAAVAAALYSWLGSPAQWIAMAIGLYAAFSWAQGLRLRDPPTFALIFRTPALVLSALGFSFIAFVTYGIGFWGAPFFLRVHGISEGEVGTFLGLAAAAGGWIGVTAGGLISDGLKRRTPRARLHMGLVTVVLSVPAAIVLLTTPNLWVAYAMNFVFAAVSPLWVGPAATLANELVLPRMRATASAFYILLVTSIGLALGPYTMGRLSDALTQGGLESGEALRQSMLLGLLALAATAALLLAALPRVAAAEATRRERARRAGEPATA